jgi:DNA-binding NtrC family response regulator
MYYKSVLLIDDDIDYRDLFCTAVRDISPEIDCKQFANGIDGVNYLNSIAELPEIIFIDIDMHIIDGLSFLKDIQENEILTNIPIYIYSTPLMIKEMEDSLKQHVTGYLFKTADFANFEHDLSEILKGK